MFEILLVACQIGGCSPSPISEPPKWVITFQTVQHGQHTIHETKFDTYSDCLRNVSISIRWALENYPDETLQQITCSVERQ
jgi:hypothetical protein